MGPASEVGRSARSTIWYRVGVVVLLLVASLALIGAAAEGISSTRDVLSAENQRSATQVQRYIDCTIRELEERVPAGSTVFFKVWVGLPYERMIEGTYPRYRVVSRPADARYIVDILGVENVEDRRVPPVGCGQFVVTENPAS